MCVIIITFNIHSSFNLFQLAWAPAVRISGSTTIDSFGDCFPWHWIIKKIVAKVIYILINDLIAQQKARHYVHFQLLFVLFTQIIIIIIIIIVCCWKSTRLSKNRLFFFFFLFFFFHFGFYLSLKTLKLKLTRSYIWEHIYGDKSHKAYVLSITDA